MKSVKIIAEKLENINIVDFAMLRADWYEYFDSMSNPESFRISTLLISECLGASGMSSFIVRPIHLN